MEKFLLLVREDINMLKQSGEEGRYKNMRQMMKWAGIIGRIRELYQWRAIDAWRENM